MKLLNPSLCFSEWAIAIPDGPAPMIMASELAPSKDMLCLMMREQAVWYVLIITFTNFKKGPFFNQQSFKSKCIPRRPDEPPSSFHGQRWAVIHGE